MYAVVAIIKDYNIYHFFFSIFGEFREYEEIREAKMRIFPKNSDSYIFRFLPNSPNTF